MQEPGEERAEVRSRCEVLGALCAGAALAVVLYGVSRAVAFGQLGEEMTGGLSAWQLVELAAGYVAFYPVQQGPGVMGLAMLVLAYLLVAVIPPGAVGRVGARVLEGVVGVGVLLALAGGIGAVAVLRQPGQLEAGFASPFGAEQEGNDVVLTVADRGGPALVVLAGGVVAGYVAWAAYQALLPVALAELDADLAEDDEDEGEPDGEDEGVDPDGAGPR